MATFGHMQRKRKRQQYPPISQQHANANPGQGQGAAPPPTSTSSPSSIHSSSSSLPPSPEPTPYAPARQTKDGTDKKRVRTGCFTCRARKVKCDEARETCLNCKRMSLDCKWPDVGQVNRQAPSFAPTRKRVSAAFRTPLVTGPGPSPSGQGRKRRSRLVSCQACRVARTRCTKDRPKCERCREDHRECEYALTGITQTTTTASGRGGTGEQQDGSYRLPTQHGVTLEDATVLASALTSSEPQTWHFQQLAAGTDSVPSEIQIGSRASVNESTLSPEKTSTAFPDIQLPGFSDTVNVWIGSSADVDTGQTDIRATESRAHAPPVTRGGEDEDMRTRAARMASPSTLLFRAPAKHTVVAVPHPNLGAGLVNDAILERHVEAYFNNIHPCQANGFLHRGVLMRQIRTRRASEMLLLAICAAASRFVADSPLDLARVPEGTEQAKAWMQEAKMRIFMQEESSSDNVAASLVLSKQATNSGRFDLAFSLIGNATRKAIILGYHREMTDSKLSWQETEFRRRLIWSCYSSDRLISSGRDDLSLCAMQTMKIRLPSDEHNYQLSIPCIPPLPSFATPDSDLYNAECVGVMGHFIEIISIRYDMYRYIRQVKDGSIECIAPWKPESPFRRVHDKINHWHQCLPIRLDLTPDAIFTHEGTRQVTPLIMLHIWYRTSMMDLHRITLPGFPETLDESLFVDAPSGWVQEQRDSCAMYARGLNTVLDLVDSCIPGYTPTDSTLPYFIYEAMRVRIQHAYLQTYPGPDGAARVEAVRDELGHDFDRLLNHVVRMSRYFSQAWILHKEMRRMMRRHHIPSKISFELNDNVDTTGTQTPDHPWLRQVRDFRRQDDHHPSRSRTQSVTEKEMGSRGTQVIGDTREGEQQQQQGILDETTNGSSGLDLPSIMGISTVNGHESGMGGIGHIDLGSGGGGFGLSDITSFTDMAPLFAENQFLSQSEFTNLLGMFGDAEWHAVGGFDADVYAPVT